MPARVAIRSIPSSANDAPSERSSSVARSTEASIAARFSLCRPRLATRVTISLDTLSDRLFNVEDGNASGTHLAGGRRHDDRRVPALEGQADGAPAALRAVGAPALVGPRDRPQQGRRGVRHDGDAGGEGLARLQPL